jgi:hypothetical protein
LLDELRTQWSAWDATMLPVGNYAGGTRARLHDMLW